MLLEMTADQVTLPEAPSIAGLTFRLFRDESDYAPIAYLMNASSAVDGVEDFVSVDWAKNYLSNTTDFDPRRDILLAEIAGEPVRFGTRTDADAGRWNTRLHEQRQCAGAVASTRSRPRVVALG